MVCGHANKGGLEMKDEWELTPQEKLDVLHLREKFLEESERRRNKLKRILPGLDKPTKGGK